MRFGAATWPWKWDGPYDGAVARIGDAGFRATELCARDDNALENYYTSATLKQLRSILDDKGMVLSQFVVKTPNLSSADAGLRKASVETFKVGVEKGKELGAQIINTVVHYPFALEMPWITDRPLVQMFTADVPSGLDWDQNWEDYVAGLSECAQYCESAGIRYSLEPHPFRYGSTTEGMLRSWVPSVRRRSGLIGTRATCSPQVISLMCPFIVWAAMSFIAIFLTMTG